MKTIVVKQKELLEILKRINLIKVNFGRDEIWIIAPVLYTTEDSIDIIADIENSGQFLKLNEKVILKFQKLEYEYLVSGEIIDIIKGLKTTVTIKFSTVRKLYNQRRALRFDINLQTYLSVKQEPAYKGVAKNISRGGAMVITNGDFEINSFVDFNINFKCGEFKALSKILWKSSYQDNNFSYGMQFIDIADDYAAVINKEMENYEKEYLKSLTMIREFEKKSGTVYKSKVAIFSNDMDVSYEIREALVKIGAENFDVFHDMKFYIDFFMEEKPKVVIIDTNTLDDNIMQFIKKIKDINDLFVSKIILILPISFAKKKKEIKPFLENAGVLFKPLIYNEFEKEIVKYL
jgi:hypothetical protein